LIKRLIRKVLGIGSKEPTVIPAAEHGIRREQISHGARRTCEQLQAAGHAAYVVGGAVRDLLLGVEPKDFDVATDATPEEVHRIVRRSRLIGRRFRLVHALYGSEIVEVSTFRAGALDPQAAAAASQQLTDEHGRMLRDNVYGTRAEDAARRDFTINALYYDPVAETVLDYHKGVADLRRRTVRMIGDPAQRYREDPVRMLRAVRFAARPGFHIAPKTAAPIAEHASLLSNVPAARLFDEMLKLLLSGNAAACVRQLRAQGLHHGLLPMLDVILEQPVGERFVTLALEQTDRRIREDKPVSPAFLFAALLWHRVLVEWKSAMAGGERPIPALHAVMDTVIDQQTEQLAIPRRFTITMKEIWGLQPRLEANSGRRPYALLEHPRFRAGYDFLALRADSGEAPAELVGWWSRFQDADSADREAMLVPTAAGSAPRRRRRRRPSGSGGAGGDSDAGNGAAPGHDGERD
jgi:poly(A) polymerase